MARHHRVARQRGGHKFDTFRQRLMILLRAQLTQHAASEAVAIR